MTESEVRFFMILELIESAVQSESGNTGEFNNNTESMISLAQQHIAEILGLPIDYPHIPFPLRLVYTNGEKK